MVTEKQKRARERNLKMWKKGQSGNPKGRPTKDVSLTTLLKEEIEKIPAGEKKGRTWRQVIVLATLRLAAEGNPFAMREVWERVDGKIKQAIGLDLPSGVTFTINPGNSGDSE